MLLAHCLFCRHQAVLVPLVAAHAGFWRMFEEKWLGYGEALAFERRVQRQPGGADAVAFEHILRRSHPLVIPGAAVLAHLERWELFPELERFVRHSTAAAQLLDDLVDAEQDRRDGNHTWVVNRLGGGEGSASLGRRLYLEGGYDTLMDEALRELALAQEVAKGLRMAAAVLALERDAGQMRSMREQVAGALTRWFFEE